MWENKKKIKINKKIDKRKERFKDEP